MLKDRFSGHRSACCLRNIFAVVIALFAALTPLNAHAEFEEIIDHVGINALQQASDRSGIDIDVREMILDLASGNFDSDLIPQASAYIKEFLAGDFAEILTSLVVPMLTAAICCRISPGRGTDIVCMAACLCVFSKTMVGIFDIAGDVLSKIAELTDAVFPVLIGFLSMTGAVSGQVLLTPVAGFISEATANVMAGYGIKLCVAAFGIACACGFNGPIRLDGIFSVIRTTVMWLSGAMLTFFIAVLSIQGMLVKGYDSAAMRTTKFAVDKILPVIGGGISDSLDSVLASVNLVKSAAGVTGMIILLAACLIPVLKLWSVSFAFKIAAAVISPVGGERISAAAVKMSQVAGLLVTIVLVTATMALLLVGAAISAGRGAA